jgi:hypothetical protein
MGKVTETKIVHAMDKEKQAILGFWRLGTEDAANNEQKLRRALAAFSTLRLERIMNGAGRNAEIRKHLVHELGLPLSSAKTMNDLTNTTIGHAADHEKDAILKFWMPGNKINAKNEKKLRTDLATLSEHRLEAIMNGEGNRKVRSKLAKQAGLMGD